MPSSNWAGGWKMSCAPASSSAGPKLGAGGAHTWRTFGEIRPANTLVEARLIGDEYLVEMEAEAVIGAGGD
jgi:hypothetical protein